MLRKALTTVISTASIAASVIAFPAFGNAANLVLSDIALDQITAGYSLTGRWSGSDGLIYYMRQLDNTLYWYGEAACCSNVAYGTINGDKAILTFAGVPKMADYGAGGLTMQISSDTYMYTIGKTVTAGGVFGGTYGSTTFSR